MSFTLKRFFLKTCIYAWQLFRGCIAFILVAGLGYCIFLVATSPDTSDSEEPVSTQPVCGRLSGKTIVLPRSYVVFWPEYEGASTWDKNSVHNKKGCEAELVSLPLVMTWPQLQPAKQSEYFRDGLRFDGLEVVIAPVEIEAFDLRTRLGALLGYAQGESIDVPAYIEGPGLYFVEHKDRTFPGVVNGYYWKEEGGKVETVFECLGSKGGQGYYNCRGEFVLNELDVLVKVGFTPEKLKDWNLIESSVSEFILSSVEK
ncbi:hypothetical protein RBU55_20810 [Pseudomonas chlororaphis subsp. aurantiaca]|uniref:hypothetical protein n=1 Tax=Pseudomonas chlororaphis TaxID=587753 RepID=UPI0014750A02|nr:hypothetical protein [Pseudomonas chlororaphis]NNB43653.1 hypothetical protein [Pseudomonas chlororaphis]WMI97993.1 hypothetical protein RBU55_20810 [Pseudomonas chlororaphis subsp. aurantiaca]